MKKLKQRWNSKTPTFWKKVQRIAILVGAVAGTIIAAPIALPAALITAAGYAIAVGTAVATVSQFTVEDAPTNTEEDVNN